MRNLNRTLVLLIALFLAGQSPESQAAKFGNQFVEFELPPQWVCILEGAEWVCQGADAAKKKEAIIILAAKLRGEQDSLDQYLAYLKQPKAAAPDQGRAKPSEVKFAKTEDISGQAWVNAMHSDSEISGFYSRYFATVKEDIGVLVTFSVTQQKYAEYQKDIDNVVKTLKVFRKPGGLNAGTSGTLFNNIQVPKGISENTVFPNVAVQGAADPARKPVQATSDLDSSLTWGLVAGGAIVLLLILKNRKKS